MRYKLQAMELLARLRPRIPVFAASLLLLLAGCASPEKELPVTTLSSGLEPLREAFNMDLGKVRLLLLVDPT